MKKRKYFEQICQYQNFITRGLQFDRLTYCANSGPEYQFGWFIDRQHSCSPGIAEFLSD